MDESAKIGRVGSSFDDFLDAGGIREEIEEQAIKALIADQLHGAMKAQGLTKSRHGAAHAHHPPTTRPPPRSK